MSIRNTEDEAKNNPARLLFTMMGDSASAIEHQEAQGQRELVQSKTQLPSKGSKFLPEMGIEVVGPCDGDPLFINARLPEGWEIVATDHSMWSDLKDQYGRVRASIFYKAAFYDRDAFLTTRNRYSASVAPVNGYDAPDHDYRTSPVHGVVTDNVDGAILWKTEPMSIEDPRRPWVTKDKAEEMALRKALEMFPVYKDWRAYWDAPTTDSK